MKLNNDEIQVAQVLDSLEVKWQRNWKGFSYIDLNGNNRKYFPDFYIPEYDYYIEYKGWVNSKLSHKMNDAVKRNKFKLLIIYSNSNRYKNLGLSLNEIKTTPTLIIDNLN